MTFVLRFFFDPGSGICLWAGNDAASDRFGYAVDLDAVPLTDSTRRAAEELLRRFDGSIDWNDPAGPSPWSESDEASFGADARALLERIRAELGDDFEVRDESRLGGSAPPG